MEDENPFEDIFRENGLPNIRCITLEPPTPRSARCNASSSPREAVSKQEMSRQSIDFCDGTSDEIVEYVNVTVKFRISETEVIARVYPNRLTIADVKRDIARKFEVKSELLRLKQCGKALSDECMLYETDKDEFGIHDFQLELLFETASSGSETQLPRLDLNVYYDKHRLADFIIVHVAGENTADGFPKDIVVEIQNKAIVKPFLCGYKNTKTGIEYLDAFTQTGPYFDKWKHRRYYSRDTQTYEYKEKLIDTMHDQSSQCFLDGNNVLFVAAAKDVTIVPRKYQSYAQKKRIENKLAKIILIQRNWRRYLLVRIMKRCAAEFRNQAENRRREIEKTSENKVKRIARENRCKQFPRTKDDFDLLYNEVEKWKIAELKRIAARCDGNARVVEVGILLDKEIQMLNGIDRQRKLVFKSMEAFRNEQLLKKLGSPIKWIGYKDRIIHMDLLRTQRVRFLSEIYKDLQKPLEKAERLDLIRKVRVILAKEQDFPGFAELFDLFDREKNLLLYTTYCDVEVLRKRQNMLFIELIRYADDTLEEKEPKTLCLICQEVKPLSAFAVRTRQKKVETCKKCFDISTCTSNTSLYMAILRSIQREERKKRCNTSFAFALQLEDIRYLVEKIWHSHSILNKTEDLSSLRLPRWIKSDDWSPWNCVCLTEEEVYDHYNVEDVNKVYDEKMRLEVANRHLLARNAFHQLALVSTEFLETGQWFKAGLTQQRVNNLHDIFAKGSRKFERASQKK